MGLVDFHAHFFSRPFFETLAVQAGGDTGVEERLDALAARTGVEIPLPRVQDHLARWIDALDRNGVDHMATFASVPEEAAAVEEAVRLSRGRLSGFALVNPLGGITADHLRATLARGAMRGVLLFPAMHHFHVAGPECWRMLHVLEDARATVYVHCGLLVVKLRDLLGLPRPYDLAYANPLGIVPAANRFPGVNFVIPHFGAGFFREALMAGTQCENVYVDTSSSNRWIVADPSVRDLADVFRRALDVFGPRRILFGTDSNVFPAGWRADRLAEQREALQRAGAGEEVAELVFGGNAERLLGLPAGA
jgi:predicted TIM-barrel fold metal-dependent hydrolase